MKNDFTRYELEEIVLAMDSNTLRLIIKRELKNVDIKIKKIEEKKCKHQKN
tara:strand:+ start:1927 stop:2079 length:153 start_codon:yes stop_codon:yes gene_type:complete